ncbi:MAG: two-component system, NtrC family, sensor kinase [Acidobacteriaceae bacterium]|nr:two-component system, NtrC family, sensor kinase [Acidobacteriaceae bacterium]
MWLLAAWLMLLAVYATVSFLLPRGNQSLTIFGNLVQCLVPLIANAGLLANAGTPLWRRNAFWMLLALGCTLWMTGQFAWTYYEVYLHRALPGMFAGDIVFFLRGIPMMAALALRPHRKLEELRLRFGYLDFVLLIVWWTFLYAYTVLPWMYATPSLGPYNHTYNIVANIQNMVLVLCLSVLWVRTSGPWKTIYANLFGGATLYMLSSLALNVAIDKGEYYTGSLYDLPLISSFLWFALAGLIAYQNRDVLDAPFQGVDESSVEAARGESVWAGRMAMAAVISLPLFAIYTVKYSSDGSAVKDFRLMATFIAAIPLALLVFLRTHLADADRVRLLAEAEMSVNNLRKLQTQIVQSEKLASLGQLAAGAAHEINNPLTAILGFSDLLAEDPSLSEKARNTAAKIRDQARRTKTLVGNLLSFARQVPVERALLDINTVVTNAVQLRTLDLHNPNIKIEVQLESVLPSVRGDGNQLIQVFFNIISNAVDAMETNGGVLTIKSMRNRANVVVLFTDSGPGIKEPDRVFDPFYTTKPVGKGTGLGLSICFGIMQEHGGKISCYNGERGGAVFRVELAALLPVLPSRETPIPSHAAKPTATGKV